MDGTAERAIDLDIGLQTIAAGDFAYRAVVGRTKQGHPVGGIGEGANLSSDVGGHDPPELGGEALAEDNEVKELLFGYIHCDPSPAIGIISVYVVG